jgi:pyruvate formate lyase activating enzyme
MFFPDRVKYAARLAASCPAGALNLQSSGGLILDRGPCRACPSHDCVRTCVDGSMELSGYPATVGGIINEILPCQRAHAHYGVTLSGGEATLQWDFYLELLKACRAHGLHTAVETNGSHPRLAQSFPLLDLVICDLKHMDNAAHIKWTGQGNAAVLENIRAAAAAPHTDLRVRIPLVPGINDVKNIDHTIAFLAPMKNNLEVEILGYHKMGVYKWKALGRECSLNQLPALNSGALQKIQDKMKRAGLCVISS